MAILVGLALASLAPNRLVSGLIEKRQARQGGLEQEFASL